jgi:hypothetical protein
MNVFITFSCGFVGGVAGTMFALRSSSSILLYILKYVGIQMPHAVQKVKGKNLYSVNYIWNSKVYKQLLRIKRGPPKYLAFWSDAQHVSQYFDEYAGPYGDFNGFKFKDGDMGFDNIRTVNI